MNLFYSYGQQPVLRPGRRTRRWMHKAGRCHMSWLHFISAVVVNGLVIGLVAAAVNPVIFS